MGAGTARAATTNETADARYERGMQMLKRIGGEGYDIPVKRLAEVAPDLARFTVEYPYGDVLCRPGLDLTSRQICTVSALIANGSAQPQLKYHMNGFLNVGGKPRELAELMFVAIAICGYTSAINGVGLLREIFKERNIAFEAIPPVADDGTRRYERGMATLMAWSQKGPDAVTGPLQKVSPELAQWVVEVAYGDLLSREGLSHQTRDLAIVSMLTSAGNRADALRFHIEAALRHGLTKEQLIEAITQLSIYAGFPAALNAFAVANATFKDWNGAVAAGPAPAAVAQSESREARRKRGSEVLSRTSAAAGEAVVRSFADIAPDIGTMIVENAYGDVFARNQISSKTRELTACAALAAVGSKTMETPLRVHVNAALTAGASREEINEALLNLVPYFGYPVVQQAIRIAGEEIAKRPT
ncbi:carboxymuconolactone decarboxylase family protein [Xanthobacter dioxanivorans]|uniref:Carboxymuconolactone decarboxylase family protein n=2 Tax=Xanthobacter dioxanivorans TaxID=2528964 RepID=A0A974SK88_9HYPH|nr:carboxymuconolactone decarboxylase family protein [Xanthobacter dioxanivorans]